MTRHPERDLLSEGALLWSGAPPAWTWRCPRCGGMSRGGLTEEQAEAGLARHQEGCRG